MEACRPRKERQSSSRGSKQDVHVKKTKKKSKSEAIPDASVDVNAKNENKKYSDGQSADHKNELSTDHLEVTGLVSDLHLTVQEKTEERSLVPSGNDDIFCDPEQNVLHSPNNEHSSQNMATQIHTELTDLEHTAEIGFNCPPSDNHTVMVNMNHVTNVAIEIVEPLTMKTAETGDAIDATSSEDKENEITGPPCDMKIKLKFKKRHAGMDKSKALVDSESCDSGTSIHASDVTKPGEAVDNTFKSILDDPCETLASRTARLTELGDLRFDENRDLEPHAIGRRSVPLIYNTSRNVFHAVTNFSFGRLTRVNEKVVNSTVATNISSFEVVDSDHPFNTRFTTLDWHPRKRNILVACSNGGDVGIYSAGQEQYSTLETVEKFPGIGAGGCITDLKFHPTEDHLFFTSSKCCKISLKDMTGKSNKILLETCDYEKWFSSVEAHQADRLVLGGRNDGSVDLITRDGEKVWKKQLHMRSITSIAFSPRDSTMFSTSSFDGTVRLWDLRKVEDKKPVDILFHMKGVSSAYFSLTDGNRLLTTDVYDEIRVYKGPNWRLETCINHPHKYFGHHTSIKASWHPFRDIIMCGRHPDLKHPDYEQFRCIDMFDAASGSKIGESKDTLYDGIPCLNKVNMDGDKLAIAMGYNVTLWNTEPTFDLRELSKSQLENFQKSRKKVCDTVKMRGRDNSIERKKKRNKKLDKVQTETTVESEFAAQFIDHDEEGTFLERERPQNSAQREFEPQFVQHIGGGRLRIRHNPQTSRSRARMDTSMQPRETSAAPPEVSVASREGETTGDAGAARSDLVTAPPSAQTGARGEEIQMEERQASGQEGGQEPAEDGQRPSREEAAPRRERPGFFARLFSHWMNRK